jgi:hypothetical protein
MDTPAWPAPMSSGKIFTFIATSSGQIFTFIATSSGQIFTFIATSCGKENRRQIQYCPLELIRMDWIGLG